MKNVLRIGRSATFAFDNWWSWWRRWCGWITCWTLPWSIWNSFKTNAIRMITTITSITKHHISLKNESHIDIYSFSRQERRTSSWVLLHFAQLLQSIHCHGYVLMIANISLFTSRQTGWNEWWQLVHLTNSSSRSSCAILHIWHRFEWLFTVIGVDGLFRRDVDGVPLVLPIPLTVWGDCGVDGRWWFEWMARWFAVLSSSSSLEPIWKYIRFRSFNQCDSTYLLRKTILLNEWKWFGIVIKCCVYWHVLQFFWSIFDIGILILTR